jgi:GMP synthase (glutamine-hydrolysing)
MRVLSIVHGPRVRAEVFGDVVLAEGHSLEEWSVVSEPAPPRPVDEYDAVFVFGGHMNVDEERKHQWLLREDDLIRSLVERRVPLFGVCLGGQLLAKASGARVGPLTEAERGFVRVTLTDEAADDPVFGTLPREFDAFEGHGYAFQVPDGAVELARSEVCTQAIRVGDCAWGVQFHPEVRLEQVAEWYALEEQVPNAQRYVEELRSRIDEWQAFGARLCRLFLAAADRARAAS